MSIALTSSRALLRSASSLRKPIDPAFFTSRPRPTSRLLRSNSLQHAISSRRAMSAFADASIYGDEAPPPVSVKTVGSSEIELLDGLVLPSACIFLEGRVFLWEVPKVDSDADWPGWTTEHFKLFEVVIPRPEILFLGTGDAAMLPPPHIKKYLNDLGIQLDVMNTWNACSTYNMLSEEGRRVATAIIPATHKSWKSQTPSQS